MFSIQVFVFTWLIYFSLFLETFMKIERNKLIATRSDKFQFETENCIEDDPGRMVWRKSWYEFEKKKQSNIFLMTGKITQSCSVICKLSVAKKLNWILKLCTCSLNPVVFGKFFTLPFYPDPDIHYLRFIFLFSHQTDYTTEEMLTV